MRSMNRGCARTTVPKIHTSPFEDANESSRGLSPPDRPNAFCPSTPPSTKPSTSNAISCRAASSNSFVLMRSLHGGRAGLPIEPGQDRLLGDHSVNVSTPENQRTQDHELGFAAFDIRAPSTQNPVEASVWKRARKLGSTHRSMVERVAARVTNLIAFRSPIDLPPPTKWETLRHRTSTLCQTAPGLDPMVGHQPA